MQKVVIAIKEGYCTDCTRLTIPLHWSVWLEASMWKVCAASTPRFVARHCWTIFWCSCTLQETILWIGTRSVTSNSALQDFRMKPSLPWHLWWHHCHQQRQIFLHLISRRLHFWVSGQFYVSFKSISCGTTCCWYHACKPRHSFCKFCLKFPDNWSSPRNHSPSF